MDGGRLLRLGTPHELLTNPGNDFVATLLSTPKRQADQIEALAADRRNGDGP
jgi:osmoprotectant transport system ATP-binding protein